MATHIGTIRRAYARNKEEVKGTFSWDELEYNSVVYNYGIEFLESQYSNSFTTKVACKKSFWTWWKAEWMLWENMTLTFYDAMQYTTIDSPMYCNDMRKMISDDGVFHSFHHNFVKKYL